MRAVSSYFLDGANEAGLVTGLPIGLCFHPCHFGISTILEMPRRLARSQPDRPSRVRQKSRLQFPIDLRQPYRE
jgi:hypothetical protein